MNWDGGLIVLGNGECRTHHLLMSLSDMFHTSIGLPTRSREVADFMTGLEKTKAKDGEAPQSARALERTDLLNLYNHCIVRMEGRTVQEMRAGVV